MKKFFTSTLFILVFSAYALYQHLGGAATNTLAQKNVPPPLAVVTPAAPSPKNVVAPASAQGKYRNGTYTGSSADAYYGTVQVQVTVVSGKIADVTFLNYPQDRGTSRSINSYAMPQLTQEAIAAQSAQVNGVSGASDTSAAFRQSLSSALTQAA